MSKKINKNQLNNWIYGLAAFGTISTFFGHGMWAIGGKESFVKLLTGSFNNVLGISIDTATATSWVKLIGWIDITISVILLFAAIGYLYSGASKTLKNLATSRIVLFIYAWGVFWGFMTAASRVTAAGVLYPEIWDLIERGPNFAIPAIGFLLTYHSSKNK